MSYHAAIETCVPPLGPSSARKPKPAVVVIGVDRSERGCDGGRIPRPKPSRGRVLPPLGRAALHALAGGEDLAKALACKGSTRFGENLSREEMEVLLREWASSKFPEVCPH